MTTTSTYAVTGMTCSHCVAAVTQALAKLSGVRDVDIDLVVGGLSAVHVSSDAAVDPAAVAEAVDEAGYAVVDRAP